MTTTTHLIIYILLVCHQISVSVPLQLEIGLNDQPLPFTFGLFPNYNLCQILSPVSVNNDKKIFVEARPNLNVLKNVRYIVLHKCQEKSNQDSFYGPYLNRNFECEDTRFVQALQTCHEEVIFMWSKGTLGDTLPPGLGINLSNSYLLMMVVYEELTEQITSEKSGLILEYEQQEDSSNHIKTAHRLMIGHQADGKHVLLSNQRDWITEGWCSGHCTQDFSLKPSDYELSVSYILGVKIFTRSLGTVAHIDVQYNNGSKFDTPLLTPSAFDDTNVITRSIDSIEDGFKLHSGDDMILRCHHSTLGQDQPTFGGISAEDELCFALLTHYCPENEFCPLTTMTSCMSRPTDENLAIALGFRLNYYETSYFGSNPSSEILNTGGSVQFVDNVASGGGDNTKSKLQPFDRHPNSNSRYKRQSSTNPVADVTSADLFLSSPTINGRTVLKAIDEFDRKSSVQEKTSANFAILQGPHLAKCSDRLGTFSKTLIQNTHGSNRKSAMAEIRVENRRYHDIYNHASSIRQLNLKITIAFPIIVAVGNIVLTLA